MEVAIDGPAGSGKSTVAKIIAQRLHFTYLDTGAMYRALTLAALRNGIDIADEERIGALAHSVEISFASKEGALVTMLNGEDVSTEIRSPQIDRAVSVVAAYPAVREAMVALQRMLARNSDVIAEGRDIGTVVFPDAQVKIFLSADARARAHRRVLQRAESAGQAGQANLNPDATQDAKELLSAEEEQVLAEIQERDAQDSARKVSPLCPAEDAHHIDSSHLSIEEVCQQIEQLIEQARMQSFKTVPSYADLPRENLLPLWGNSQDDYFSHCMAEYSLPVRIFYRIVAIVANAWSKLMWHWEIEDEERLYKTSNGRGAVIIMNHVSMLDPLLPPIAAIKRGHRIRPVYKSEFDDTFVLGWCITRFGGFSIKRDSVDMRALRSAKAALERGESILIFPEGTRIKSDDEPVVIHGGFAMIAQMAGADIIPTAIVGARDITPRHKHIPRPGKVWIKVGRPITTSHIKGKDRKKLMREVEERAMQEVYSLRDELRKEHPGVM